MSLHRILTEIRTILLYLLNAPRRSSNMIQLRSSPSEYLSYIVYLLWNWSDEINSQHGSFRSCRSCSVLTVHSIEHARHRGCNILHNTTYCIIPVIYRYKYSKLPGGNCHFSTLLDMECCLYALPTDADADAANYELSFTLQEGSPFSLTEAMKTSDLLPTYDAQLVLDRPLDYATNSSYRLTITAQVC